MKRLKEHLRTSQCPVSYTHLGMFASWSSNVNTAISYGGYSSYERSSVVLECVDNQTGVGVQHLSLFNDIEAEVLSNANYEVVEVVKENKYDFLKKHQEYLYSPDDLEENAEVLRAVSYTHLDVYKRQVTNHRKLC